jgi:hypothetical protein
VNPPTILVWARQAGSDRTDSINGTQWVAPTSFRHWLETGVDYTWKRGTDPMELADMVSRDLSEWLETGCKD